MLIPKEIISIIAEKKSFLGHIHLSPDPDSIGSMLALKLALEAEGKVVNIFCEDPLIEISRFLPGADLVEQTSFAGALTHPHVVYLCVDTAKWVLASHNPKAVPQVQTVVIDHHADNSIVSDLRWVDPGASSAAQLVFNLLVKLKYPITPNIATCLLFGVMGDTGMFLNNNAKVSDLALAQKLIKRGADFTKIKRQMLTYNPRDLKFMALALNSLNFASDGSYAWMKLSHEDCQQMEGEAKIGFLANQFAGKIAGTEFGAILAEKDKGITKGSLRSRLPEFDVAAICHRLGGGGHKNAASFKLELSLPEAEKKFLEAVEYVKANHK